MGKPYIMAIVSTPDTIAAVAADEPPKLVVVLVVDQMRADYIDKFQHQWTAGLHRLVTEGAWYRLAAYPYLNTWTCATHATIATGSFPASHGVTQNNWWDRDASRLAACTEDAGGRPSATVPRWRVDTVPGISPFRHLVTNCDPN